jgi:hypothetical protein
MTRTRLGLGALTAVVLLIVAPLGPDASAAGQVPPVFDVESSGTAARMGASVPSALPLIVDGGAARSSVAINSQPNAVSQAAPGWSPLAEAAPALLGTPPLPVAVWCYSYFPGDPREASCGGPVQEAGPLAAGGAGHTVTNGEVDDPTTLRSESSTVVAGARSTAAAPQAFTFSRGASAATAGAEGDRMASGAATSIDDLVVAGVFSVRTIRSAVTAALGGVPGSAAHEASLVVSGAEVAGQAVTVDGTGVHVADQTAGGELFAAQDQVNQALAAAGLEVRTVSVPAQVSGDGTSLDVSSGGLLVSMAVPDGQGGRVDFLFGESRVRMSAHQVDAPPDEPALPVGDAPPPLADVAGASEATLEIAPPPPAPVAGAGAGAPTAQPFRQEVAAAALADAGWRIPYKPFALLVLAVPLLVQARRLNLYRR